MSHWELTAGLLIGLVLMFAPLTLPLFFLSNNPRKPLFYFLGVACSYLCYKVSIVLWVFLALLISSLVTSMRHEDSMQGIQNSFDLAIPGLKQGHMFLGLLPDVTLGTLLSLLTLRKLKAALLKGYKPAKTDPA